MHSPARRLTVLSGKGGVGKTLVTANLAAALAAKGTRVLVVDADLGLANLDVILKLSPAYTLQDLLYGRATLDETILPTQGGFDILPGGSALAHDASLTPTARDLWVTMLATLQARYDLIVFDAGAGIGDIVQAFAQMGDEILLLTTPEPTALLDAYATLKVLLRHSPTKPIRLIINQTVTLPASQDLATHLMTVATRFLDAGHPVPMTYMGAVPLDPLMASSVARQQLLFLNHPTAPASLAIATLAKNLLEAGALPLAAR